MKKQQQQSLINFFSPTGVKTLAKASPVPQSVTKKLKTPIISGHDKYGKIRVEEIGDSSENFSQLSEPLSEDVNLGNTEKESDIKNSDLGKPSRNTESESPVKKTPVASKKYKRIRIEDSDEDDGSDSSQLAETEQLNKSLCTPVAKSRKVQPPLESESPSQLLSPFSFSSATPVNAKESNINFNESFTFQKTPKSKSLKKIEVAEDAENDTFKHLGFKFLKMSQVKDKLMRPVDHPDYDPTTLHVPKDFLNDQTPGHQQWWMFKSNYFDTILFFKVGKFYELYHMDAVTAVEELGLTYMRGDYAHCGFPEIGFDKFSDILVQKGYKIARVEQTETPDEMQSRISKMSKSGKKVMKYDKVVARELCQITTKATQLPTSVNNQGTSQSCANNFLMAIVEKTGEFNTSSYGVCFVDTKIGTLNFSQFADDRFSSLLRVFFSHLCPVEIIHPKSNLSAKTMQVIKSLLPSVKLFALKNESQFYSGVTALKKVQESSYFDNEKQWPELLQKASQDELHQCDKIDSQYELAVNAFGGILFKLKQFLIDYDIITLGDFVLVEPPIPSERLNAHNSLSSLNTSATNSRTFARGAKMILDSSTIANLGIVDNFGKSNFTLLTTLDTCMTPFGKRMLKQVLCSPPCDPYCIKERQEAIVWLMNNRNEFVEKVQNVLQKCPDLEQLLCRVHSLSVDRCATDHPDSRANFFEVSVYKKRNVQDFVLTLNTLKKCLEIARIFGKLDCESDLLNYLLSSKSEGGKFPSGIDEFIGNFESSFDQKEACETGEIQPKPGLAEAYDRALEELARIKNESERYLREQKKMFRCERIQYATSKSSQFQLEVPADEVSRVPDEYQFASKRKGWDRFQTTETLRFVQRWTAAESNRDESLKNLARLVFSDFSKEFAKCSKVVRSIATLDVLIALAEFSRTADPVMCRPQVLDQWDTFLDIKNGKHPCMENVMKGGYIPNDMKLGKGFGDPESQSCDSQTKGSYLVLLTGPNMGGKSTLMRQTGLLVILAQLGCFVPAEKMSFTPVDRVFTRLGAMDRILCGESTFFVEMSETCVVLNYATRHSLVLLDELGRGTSTFDGTAIASAVARKLANEIGCRTLFSTHYHLLVSDFRDNPRVFLGHMACMEEDTEEEDEDGVTEQRVTFLYKFVQGSCPKSYGFNAARMAGIDSSITRQAQQYSSQLEDLFLERQKFIHFGKLFANLEVTN
ncbi:DNA mismatch repair protein Msh6-like [Symsagittifera roscoffensis]|uniref:DNA mismatch repair protein Msh6-like n=1 Tax=Symsagittifera roscoffensis TaxID=84072 RepID=UPI00307C0C01